ncbi:MAG: type II toxin-antitoxin system RelE/ParE family toxin [Hyphomicrobium sp.]
MRLSWSPRARSDIEAIYDWIAPHDRRAALRVVREIRRTAELLQQFPGIGRRPVSAKCVFSPSPVIPISSIT